MRLRFGHRMTVSFSSNDERHQTGTVNRVGGENACSQAVPEGTIPDMLTVFLENPSGFVLLLTFSMWVRPNSRLEESGIVEYAPQERGEQLTPVL